MRESIFVLTQIEVYVRISLPGLGLGFQNFKVRGLEC